MRHLGVTTLLAMWLLLLPAAARAALGIDTLQLTVKTEGTNGVDSVFQVAIAVTGTEIASARVTPAGGSAIALSCSSATSCSVTQNLPNQAALDALLPTTAKNYTIALTGTSGTPPPTITDTISFARPAVPSPTISAPVHGSIIEPGPLEVLFLDCASCNVETLAGLLQGDALLEGSYLPATSTSWEPATSLAIDTGYTVQITHEATGMQAEKADGVGSGTEDDDYSLTFSVTHSDRVTFSTANPPTGYFCIVVNHSDAAADVDLDGCTVIDEPPSGILDTSGTFDTSAAGIAIEYDLLLAPNGRLSDIAAAADLDGDGSLETPAELAGQLKGKDGQLRQRFHVRFDDLDSQTRLKVRIREEANLATLLEALDLEWLQEQRARLKRPEEKLSETTTDVRTQLAPRTGWKLSFTLTGMDGPVSGKLELESGLDDVALAGKQRFDTLTNQSSLKLESEGAERGVRMHLKKLVIAGVEIVGGTLRFKAFGQGGSVLLPPPPTLVAAPGP